MFFLNDEYTGGVASAAFRFGPPDAGLLPVAGDWDGDGRATVGLYDPASGQLLLSNRNAEGEPALLVQLDAGGLPVAGDWEGRGRASAGTYDPSTATFHLLKDLKCADAPCATTITFGPAGGLPIAGDWWRTGRSDIGVFDPAAAVFWLRDQGTGEAKCVSSGGRRLPALPIAGRWNPRFAPLVVSANSCNCLSLSVGPVKTETAPR